MSKRQNQFTKKSKIAIKHKESIQPQVQLEKCKCKYTEIPFLTNHTGKN